MTELKPYDHDVVPASDYISLLAERDTLKAAIEQLLENLPETWGDKIHHGHFEMNLDAEAIDAALAAVHRITR